MIKQTKSIIKRLRKGTIQGIRFFFIMLVLEYVIEKFFNLSGASLGHVDTSEYVIWLLIFALTFYLSHYMITIKWGKTINSISIYLRNKKHIYNIEFYLSDIIIAYFLYICTFYVSTFITNNYKPDLVIFVFLYPLYGLCVWLSMFLAKIVLANYPKIINAISKAINIAITVFILILSVVFLNPIYDHLH